VLFSEYILWSKVAWNHHLHAVLTHHVREEFIWMYVQTDIEMFEEMKSNCTIKGENMLVYVL